MEKTLTQCNISNVDFGNSVTATIYTTEDGSGCFLSNANTTTDATITFQGSGYVVRVPAWSVSIFPDCKYNTAKVNAQTSLMVKKSNKAEEEPASLRSLMALFLKEKENLPLRESEKLGKMSCGILSRGLPWRLFARR
ncbi:hypothetical protein LWI28_010110 [Acer negundo]|uniref:Beta-galactosidase beta-sandwich domain-containing protein n=1 Tax=Acer negundo TaxID=4023 RepID=A0AAD5NRT6_ACENE|nr:hypothetical protein LWI28_010110 [Acer negundo]